MGLAEKRAAKDFETKQFPELKKRVDDAAGFPVELEVAWDTLAVEGESNLYADCWPKVYFEPLRDALKAITADDMGKEALKGTLKKITIQNKNGIASESTWASFTNGELVLDHRPHSNVDYGGRRADALRKVIESKL
jgi:hypothetical protein